MQKSKRGLKRVRFVKKKKDDHTKKIVKRILNKVIEKKQTVYSYTDIVPISVTVGSKWYINIPNAKAYGDVIGSVATITSIPGQQGFGGYQHIGNKILLNRIEFSALLYQAAPATLNNVVRVMVIHDKKAQGKAMTTSEFLWDVGSGNAVASPRKINGNPTYRILYDKTFQFKNSGQAAGGQCSQFRFRFRKTFKEGLPVTYYPDYNNADPSSQYTGIQDNALTVVMFADTANVGVKDAYTNMIYQDA